MSLTASSPLKLLVSTSLLANFPHLSIASEEAGIIPKVPKFRTGGGFLQIMTSYRKPGGLLGSAGSRQSQKDPHHTPLMPQQQPKQRPSHNVQVRGSSLLQQSAEQSSQAPRSSRLNQEIGQDLAAVLDAGAGDSPRVREDLVALAEDIRKTGYGKAWQQEALEEAEEQEEAQHAQAPAKNEDRDSERYEAIGEATKVEPSDRSGTRGRQLKQQQQQQSQQLLSVRPKGQLEVSRAQQGPRRGGREAAAPVSARAVAAAEEEPVSPDAEDSADDTGAPEQRDGEQVRPLRDFT